MRLAALALSFSMTTVVLTGCADTACDKAVNELGALRPDTIKSAPADLVTQWQAKLEAARATCGNEKRPERLDRIAEVATAVDLRAADFTIEEANRAAAARSAGPAPPPPPKWTVPCGEIVHDNGFHGLLAPGLPRNVAGFLAPGTTALASPEGGSPAGVDAGAPPAPPQEALILGARPVYLSARDGKLEGSVFDGGRFTVQQSLGWPAEAAREGASVDRMIAARGEGTLAIVWIADLRVFFAVLDVASERWSSFAELAVSGDDGGRDLKLGDVIWGRSSFGIVLGTARGFAFIEVLPDGKQARPAKLQPAFIAGTPRIAWDGQQYMIAAGRPDGEPSMGIWRAPTGASNGVFMTLLDRVPAGEVEPLTGELLAKDGAVHLGFRVRTSPVEATTYLGHANGDGAAQLEKCP